MTLLALDGLDVESAEPVRQWRLAEVQLLNWGTFDGLHRVPIARKGQLITGASGSGKSSLLDGIAAVLTPDKWLQFNAAAQGTGARAGDRSIPSYVRGAWSKTADEAQDRVVSRFLRPASTVSGVLLRFDDGAGATATLARLLFLKGTSNDMQELRDACILEQGELSLETLRGFASSRAGGIDTRALKAAFPKAVVTSNRQHAKFYLRLGHVLGIAGDQALQLLHRTQAAKNLGSLDHLFRTFMLDRPGTFALAESAVAQFGELDAAHKHVVELRQQRDALTTMRDQARAFDEAATRADAARALHELVGPFEARRRLQLARQERVAAAAAAEQASLAVTQTRRVADLAAEDHRLAQQLVDRAGGADLSHLVQRIADAEHTVRERQQQRDALLTRLADVGIEAQPRGADDFAALRSVAHDELARPEATVDVAGATAVQLHEAKATLARLERDLEALQRSRSNLDPRRLEARERLVAHLGLPEAAVPFAGELLEVLAAERAWTGAIERVLRPLATTLLVPARHIAAARAWIDAEYLGTRLIYEAVPAEAAGPRKLASDASLVRKLRVADGTFHGWLSQHLAEHYDIACVETADELDRYARAVTIRGQVKRSATRYEKDDTSRVDDATRWLLGSGDERHEALVSQRAAAQQQVDAAWGLLERQQRDVNQANRRRQVLQDLLAESWERYDGDAARERVAQFTAQRDGFLARSSDLQRADAAERAAREGLDAAKTALEEAVGDQRDARRALADIDASVTQDERAIDADGLGELDASAAEELERRFTARRRRPGISELAGIAREVETALSHERERELTGRNTAAEAFAGAAAAFKARWEAAAADLVPLIDDRAGFAAMLESIEVHDLPSHEQSFRSLLREKSSTVVGYLRKEILDAPKEVRERIDPVNVSLGRSEFDRDRFLRIKVKLSRGDTVTEFLADLAKVAAGSWDEEDAVSAERRFSVLADLMRRLASSEPGERRWRELVLDTRGHVSFLAEVVGRDGTVLETFDSGASLSGGQQQKLVVFCLAAALRYQLTEDGQDLPRYGTVILDEAFDKADSTYTRMAMDVFLEFGFHMVLATPLKLLQTLEPYLGGVAVVQNADQRQSTVDLLPFEAAPVETAP